MGGVRGNDSIVYDFRFTLLPPGGLCTQKSTAANLTVLIKALVI